jgi:hypothetical protein
MMMRVLRSTPARASASGHVSGSGSIVQAAFGMSG